MNSEETPLDGNIIAAAYDEQICLGLVRFGYLTARMIAGLIRDASPSGLRTAQRRLKALVGRKWVLSERLPNGIPVYKLSAKGAAFLRELGHDDVPRRGTRDARLGNAYHRALTNNFLIFYVNPALDYWPEYSILRGRAPLEDLPFENERLRPDALIDTPGDTGMSWVEAENAPKRPKRLTKLIRFADHLFADWNGFSFGRDGVQYVIRQMVFICPAPAQARAIARAFTNVMSELPPGGETKNRVHIVHAPMPSSLIWPEIRWETAHELAVKLGYIEDEEPAAER